MNIFVFHIHHSSANIVDVSWRSDDLVRALLAKWLAAFLACDHTFGRLLLSFARSILKIRRHVKNEFILTARK